MRKVKIDKRAAYRSLKRQFERTVQYDSLTPSSTEKRNIEIAKTQGKLELLCGLGIITMFEYNYYTLYLNDIYERKTDEIPPELASVNTTMYVV